MTNKTIIDRLHGVFPPVATPFNRRGGIDEGAFRANVQKYAKTGLQGVLVAGTNGEAPFLTLEERLRLVDLARPILNPRQLLMAGTGLESTAQTLKLSRESIARGADAVLVVPPAYYRAAMRAEVLETHYRAVADGIRRPLLIYSIPQCTGFAMDAAMLARLSRHPNIPGMKESSGNIDFARAILGKARKGFRLFIGSALAVSDGLQLGACGTILSQSNFDPEICLRVYEAVRGRNAKLAGTLCASLAILAHKVALPFGIPGTKVAMDLSGYRGGDPRSPLMPLGAQDRKKIAAALEEARAGLNGA